jgi:hypothetical protein
MGENLTQLRKLAHANLELDLLAAIWDIGIKPKQVPGYEIVKEYVQQQSKPNADVLMELEDEYELLCEADGLKVHGVPDMDQLLVEYTREYETSYIQFILERAAHINTAGVKDRKDDSKRYKGPKEAIRYLMQQLECGVLLGGAGNGRPIVVQEEAHQLGSYYDRMLARGALPIGISVPPMAGDTGEDLAMYPNDFFGVLGYLGGGKSTLCRFMVYQLALAGYTTVHISLENEAIVERNKFLLLHAHHSKFGGRYANLSYKGYKGLHLTSAQRRMLDEIATDYKATVPGKIIIRQPQEASWESIKALVETQSLVAPVDALFIDYLSLLEPSGNPRSQDDRRSRMTALIKDVRQFALTAQPEHPLVVISPIQANEEGLKKAEEAEGVYKKSAVNNDKELARSMTYIIGVYDNGFVGNTHSMKLSCVKARDGDGFRPFTTYLSSCGWVSSDPMDEQGNVRPVSQHKTLDTIEDVPF